MIPPRYIQAKPRAVLRPSDDGDIAFSVDTADGAVRLRMSQDDLLSMASAMLDEIVQRRTAMASQPDKSSGNPSSDGSPQEGQ